MKYLSPGLLGPVLSWPVCSYLEVDISQEKTLHRSFAICVVPCKTARNHNIPSHSSELAMALCKTPTFSQDFVPICRRSCFSFTVPDTTSNLHISDLALSLNLVTQDMTRNLSDLSMVSTESVFKVPKSQSQILLPFCPFASSGRIQKTIYPC